MKKKALLLLSLFILCGVHAPFLLSLAGDAQVHLAFSERWASGQLFRYNESGELVNASTSPFWTVLLTFFFLTSHRYAPLLLKIVVVACWALTSYLLYKMALDFFQLRKFTRYALIGIWLTNAALISNALSGLENILACLQLLLLCLLSVRCLTNSSKHQNVIIGLMIGWMILTRPDGGFFGILVVLSFFVMIFLIRRTHDRQRLIWPVLKNLAITLSIGLAVVLPWYAFQYLMAGSLMTDSSAARFFAGRRESVEIIQGVLYFHPKSIVTLSTAFFPISLGCVISLASMFSRLRHGNLLLQKFPAIVIMYHDVISVIVICAGVLFYTFIVGADHFGRYFLPIFPFFFLFGCQGLERLYDQIHHRNILLSHVMSTAAIVFLILANGLDFYRRVSDERCCSGNLTKTISAPLLREEFTDSLLAELGVPAAESIKLAISEVQLRYFVDRRIEILSLDGRSSAKILHYIDKTTGMPDFERYLADERPDFIELGQWCSGGGWLSKVFSLTRGNNMLCQWEKKIAPLRLGDSFDWNGHQVIYVRPHMVRIAW